MKLYTFTIKQDENDLIPKKLAQYADESLKNLPKIIKQVQQDFITIKKLIVEITLQ